MFETHGRHLDIGIWIVRTTAIFPGLVLTLRAMYSIATQRGSTLGMALLASGLLLTGVAVKLLSLLVRKRNLLRDHGVHADE